MSSNDEIIEVKMFGMEVKGTVKQIAELKKLLDSQTKIIYVYPQQTYPWQTYPSQPFVTYGKTTAEPSWTITGAGTAITGSMQGITYWNGDPNTNGSYSSDYFSN